MDKEVVEDSDDDSMENEWNDTDARPTFQQQVARMWGKSADTSADDIDITDESWEEEDDDQKSSDNGTGYPVEAHEVVARSLQHRLDQMAAVGIDERPAMLESLRDYVGMRDWFEWSNPAFMAHVSAELLALFPELDRTTVWDTASENTDVLGPTTQRHILDAFKRRLVKASDHSGYTRPQRVAIISDMLEQLVYNSWFVHEHAAFSHVLEHKLLEFAADKDVRYERQFFQLFGYELPNFI